MALVPNNPTEFRSLGRFRHHCCSHSHCPRIQLALMVHVLWAVLAVPREVLVVPWEVLAVPREAAAHRWRIVQQEAALRAEAAVLATTSCQC